MDLISHTKIVVNYMAGQCGCECVCELCGNIVYAVVAAHTGKCSISIREIN